MRLPWIICRIIESYLSGGGFHGGQTKQQGRSGDHCKYKALIVAIQNLKLNKNKDDQHPGEVYGFFYLLIIFIKQCWETFQIIEKNILAVDMRYVSSLNAPEKNYKYDLILTLFTIYIQIQSLWQNFTCRFHVCFTVIDSFQGCNNCTFGGVFQVKLAYFWYVSI